MTRPLKELLQILLDEVERNGLETGLCEVNFRLWCTKFDVQDYKKVKEFFKSKLQEGSMWLFPKGETAPRIEFLKNEIEKI